MHSEENSHNLIGLKIYPPLLFLPYPKIYGTAEGWQCCFLWRQAPAFTTLLRRKHRQKCTDSHPPHPPPSHWGREPEGGDMAPLTSATKESITFCVTSPKQAYPWLLIGHLLKILKSNTQLRAKLRFPSSSPKLLQTHLGSLTVPTTHLQLMTT